MVLKRTISGWKILSNSLWAYSMEVKVGLLVQKLMSLLRTVRSFWRWVLIAKAWICFSSVKEVHLGRRERGFCDGFMGSILEIFPFVLDFEREIEVNGDGAAAIAANKS